MSFKRDGNDNSLFSVLQRRRIKDLLSEDIPEKEAKLLSNGRFACLVCSHHPIFDTVSMLSVHRHGKKHKSYATIQDKKQDELRQLIAQRKHEELLRSGSTQLNLATANTEGLSSSSPYDPRVRKHKGRKGDRKLKLKVNLRSDPNSQSFLETDNVSAASSTCTTYEPSTQNYTTPSSSHFLRVAEHQLKDGPVMHDHKLKNIFGEKGDEMVRISPYIPKVRPSKDGISKSVNVSVATRGFAETRQTTTHSHEEAYSDGYQNSYSNTVRLCSESPVLIESTATTQTQSRISSKPFTALDLPTSHTNQPISSASEMRQVKRKRRDQTVSPTANTIAWGKDSLTEKLYRLQGSGWKRDWDGKWIKDEEVEFDSDEDPPDIP